MTFKLLPPSLKEAMHPWVQAEYDATFTYRDANINTLLLS